MADSTARRHCQLRLGLELRRLREAAGLTAVQSAALLGMNRVQISHIESGITGVIEERLRRLASHYDELELRVQHRLRRQQLSVPYALVIHEAALRIRVSDRDASNWASCWNDPSRTMPPYGSSLSTWTASQEPPAP